MTQVSEIIVALQNSLAWLNGYSGAVQAIATIILIGITCGYVILTWKLVKDTRRERESPKIEELVNSLITPLKNIARSNLEFLEKREYGYSYGRKEISRIFKLTPFETPSPFIVRKFEKDYPKLADIIRNCNDLRDELEMAVDDLAQNILEMPGFRKKCFRLIDEYNEKCPTNKKLTQSDLEDYPEILLGDIIDKTEHFNQADSFIAFWEMYRDEFIKFLEKKEEIIEKLSHVKKLTNQLVGLLRTVVKELEDEEYKLWEEYYIEIKSSVLI